MFKQSLFAVVTLLLALPLVSVGSQAQTGTVTNFTAGNLPPLFTTGVATPTTTPSLTFTPSTAAQGAVLAGPPSGGSGAYSFRLLSTTDLPAIITATTLNSAMLNGYITVDGKTYTTLNAAWTAAAAICTGGSSVSPTIWLPPGMFNISSSLVEPETGICGVNLIGSGDSITQIIPTATMTAVILKAATVQGNSGLTFKGFSINGTPYVSGTGYVTYASYGIWLQFARYVRITDVTIANCGTAAAGGEDFAFGEDGSPSGHNFSGEFYNLTTNYDDGIYTGPAGGAGPTPPA